MDVMNKSAEEIFKALGNDTRLSIVKLLLKKGGLSCQQIQKHFPLSQPTMSHHFTWLVDTGVIKVKKEGASHLYSLNQERLEKNGIYLNRGGEK